MSTFDQMISRKASTIVLLILVLELCFLNLSLQRTVHAYETITRRYSFETGWYSTKTYDIIVEVPTQTYDYYGSASHPWAYWEIDGTFEFHLSKYVIPDSVGNIPQTIASYTNGGEEEIADAVLSFVQDIGYVSGDYQVDNTLYPVETLVLGGVCDDLSVLYATMMYALDFDLIFLHFTDENHVCVGVHLSIAPQHTDLDVYYWTYKGQKYYPAETTDEGWLVGELSEDLEYAYIEEVKSRGFPSLPPVYGEIDEYSLDTDNDGISDGAESNTYDTNPYKSDTDYDGLSDYDEIFVHYTDPLDPDSDNDGLKDGPEITQGTNPLVSDSDGDGLTDGEETSLGTNPSKADTDDDSWNDSIDPMPTNELVPNFIIIAILGGIVGVAVIVRRKRLVPAEMAPPSALPTYYCPVCGSELTYIPDYQRWYCPNCKSHFIFPE